MTATCLGIAGTPVAGAMASGSTNNWVVGEIYWMISGRLTDFARRYDCVERVVIITERTESFLEVDGLPMDQGGIERS